MRQVLKRELAKVFYEQFAELDTSEAIKTVDTNEVDLKGDIGDYYYYNYPEYEDDEYYYYEYLDWNISYKRPSPEVLVCKIVYQNAIKIRI